MAFTNQDPASPVILNVSALQFPAPSDLPRRFCKVSMGDTNITVGSIVGIKSDEIATIFATAPVAQETYLWLVNFFANNANGTAYVLEVGVMVSTPALNIAALATFLAAGKDLCGSYSVPQAFYGVAAFTPLVTAASNLESNHCFFVEINHGVLASTDADYLLLAGKSAFFPVYPSAVVTESASGAIAGKCASPIYDLSSTNKNTMLQYKTLVGVTAEKLTSSFRQDLVNSAVNFAGTLLGNTVIFNGRYADNTAWDYRYAWDTIRNAMSNALLTALLNGSNVPSARVAYNQDGIDKLLAIINAQGDNGILNGTITDFAESLDNTGTVLVNKNTFFATPYYEYIQANPTKYAAEAYDGLAGIIRIGRFFRKVTFNVTLN